MSEPFLGEIRLFPYNFAPKGWATCAGQLLPISQNTALFSLLGTTYGGNGQTTFALPDLRGRRAINYGQGPGLADYSLGQTAGTETATLTIESMPPHNHPVNAVKNTPDAGNANGTLMANGSFYQTGPPDINMNPMMIGVAGGGKPFEILDPYLTLNYCIALEGIFPSRN